MQQPIQNVSSQAQAPAAVSDNSNTQRVDQPQLGSVTGDPALDEALAMTMQAIPKGADQVMANLLSALQPYLQQPGTGQEQGNPV